MILKSKNLLLFSLFILFTCTACENDLIQSDIKNEHNTLELSFEGSATVEEGKQATYTITSKQTFTVPIEIRLNIFHVSTTPEDLKLNDDNIDHVILNAGQNTVSFQIEAINDNLPEKNEQYQVKLDNPKFMPSPNPDTNTTTTFSFNKNLIETEIIDSNTPSSQLPKLTLTGPNTVNEGQEALYTLTLDKILEKDLTLTTTLKHQETNDEDFVNPPPEILTIPARQSTSTLKLQIAHDNLKEQNESYQIIFTQPHELTFETHSITTQIIDQEKPPQTTKITVSDAEAVIESKVLSYDLELDNPSTTELTLKLTTLFNNTPIPHDQLSKNADPFSPGEYLANGTVFTRGVDNMPIHKDSEKISEYASQMSSKHNKFGVHTSLNTISYNIPIYIVDSNDPKQTYAYFESTDPRIKNVPSLITHTLGKIPLPAYATPAGGNDESFAVYDKATGIMREYFKAQKIKENTWKVSSAGFHQAKPGLKHIAEKNFWMQLDAGGSSVVMMLNPLSQIGISEILTGEINHALSVTLPDAKAGVISFPAKLSDGQDPSPYAPAEGQWFRIPKIKDGKPLNLETYLRNGKPLSKLTILIAKAIQKYGGYGADRNLHNFAFNAEPAHNYLIQGLEDPWRQGGEIAQSLGGEYLDEKGIGHNPMFLNDFPWELTEWAEIGWNDKATDKAIYLDPQLTVILNKKELKLNPEGGEITLPIGTQKLTVKVQTLTNNNFFQTNSVKLTAELLKNEQLIASDSGMGEVKDARPQIAKIIKGQAGNDILLSPNFDPAQYDTISKLRDQKLLDYIRENGSSLIKNAQNKLSHTIMAGKGNDILVAGSGIDFLKGEEGADTFVFIMDAQNSFPYFAVDNILDFNPKEGDKILLTMGKDWYMGTSDKKPEFAEAKHVQRLQYKVIKNGKSFINAIHIKAHDGHTLTAKEVLNSVYIYDDKNTYTHKP